jgi:transposase
MEPRVCYQEWLRLCQELYYATVRWVGDHPDAASADIERVITTTCTYLHAHLTDALARHHNLALRLPKSEAATGALIRFAPAVWRCQDTDDLVSIAGIAGYSHDGQVLYLAAAQSSTGIPLPDIVRYADDPTDPYAPLVAAQPQGTVDDTSPASTNAPGRDAEPVNQTEHRSLVARLLPASAAVRVEGQTIHAQTITVALASTQTSGCCPACGAVSQRIHGSYVRTLADCSWAEHQVVLRVQVRRFVCATPGCARWTFTDDRSGLTTRSARRTLRLTVRLRQIGLALGGQAGARLAQQQQLPTSPDTLLRLIRASVTTPARAPRVLGIDDWAFKKGHRYGSILVDLETRQPIDLLPDRTADSVAAWLRDHPGAEIVCRDRAPAYADGVTRGAPQAIQVADRFHLLLNMREALQRLCTQQQAALQAASVPPPSADAAAPMQVADPSSAADSSAAARTDAATTPTARVHARAPDAAADEAASPPDPRPPTKQERQRQACRAVRVARYEEVRTLHAQGLGNRAIARQLGISRNTVKRFLAAAVFPEQATRGATTSILDPYKPYLQQQVAAGGHTARQLWEELRAQGFTGSAGLVRQYVGTLRVGHRGRGSRTPQPPALSETTAPPPAIPPPKPRRLSARRAAWLLLCPETQRTTEQQAQVEQVLQASAPLAAAHPLVQDFGSLIRKRQRDTLDTWLQRALESGVDELVSFARGIQQTYAEVAAALELPWSSGQVEGQINRLKTIKRQLYGRAGFALLRAMVLAPG